MTLNTALQRKPRVLLVDDELIVLKAIREVLTRAGFDVNAVGDALQAEEAAADPELDVILLDIQMPQRSGLDLLRDIKIKHTDVEVIMMTAFGTVETAVKAVKAGAYDYVTKPFDDIDELIITVQKAAERRTLLRRNRALENMLETKDRLDDIIGQSSTLQSVFKTIQSVSNSSASVIIQGESGTGKELVARAIHRMSPRSNRPFVAVNCSALSETLLESELFGHVKGAFTGAMHNQKGLFEAAHGGTIFLDEIGDTSPAMQVRLLRVLQEGEVKRVGSHETVRIDTRVIAATNVNLARAMVEKRFRSDLYYRLNVVSIELPALRERRDDIPLLAHHFLRQYAKKAGGGTRQIEPDAMAAIMAHNWPGNVRELEHAIERSVVLAQGDRITVDDLPPTLSSRAATINPAGAFDGTNLAQLPYNQAKQIALQAFERRYLDGLLRKSDGNISSAARAAGLDRSNFRRLLRQCGVRTGDAATEN